MDLKEYTTVEFSGKNGNGYAEFYLLEPEKLYRDLWTQQVCMSRRMTVYLMIRNM